MRKSISVVVLVLIIFIMLAPVSTGYALSSLTAAEIMQALINAGYPINSVVEYDERTDLNGLLGRPNQYTSKVNASDARISPHPLQDPADIVIEVFDNIEDCSQRKAYIASFNTAFIGQYLYQIENVFLRVDYGLVPEEAEAYHEAVTAILTGGNERPDIAIEGTVSPASVLEIPDDSLSAAQQIEIPSRDNPALVGERVVIETLDGTIAVTILYSFRKEASRLIARSFDWINTSSYIVNKGNGWALLYLEIEALDGAREAINLSEFDFHFVDANGTEKPYAYLIDNPKPLTSMYVGGLQHSWIGSVVDENEKLFMTYQELFSGKTYWFDLSMRTVVDTSSQEYPEVKNKDTGALVDAIQMMLTEYGCMKVAPSGKFDSSTVAGLKRFQRAIGVKATGIADTPTLRRLFSGEPLPEE